MRWYGRWGVVVVVSVASATGCRTGFPSGTTGGRDSEPMDTAPPEGLDGSLADTIVSDTGAPMDGAFDSALDTRPDAADAADTDPDAPPMDGTTTDGGCVQAYLDMDGDGYGTGPAIRPCPGGSGYSELGGDCDDDDRDVFPGQTAYFATPRTGGGYDYDCNGADQAEYRLEFMCAAGGSCIVLRRGFYPPVPACGEAGTLVLDCVGTDSCTTIDSATTQRCH